MEPNSEKNSPLGKETIYPDQYDPKLLFKIPRKDSRRKIGVESVLPFYGVDIWNAYELSWLNPKGLPQVAFGEITIPCESDNIIESKSLKIYLNSFNQSRYPSREIVENRIKDDLSKAAHAEVKVQLYEVENQQDLIFKKKEGICLDRQDVQIDTYDPDETFLRTSDKKVEECLYSHLMKSNCPVTGQPDWATVYIDYSGRQIDHTGLLKYIVSFRNHNGFHENCVEQLFVLLNQNCSPEKLSVYARYTRRGGLDINPYRSSHKSLPNNIREIRQ